MNRARLLISLFLIATAQAAESRTIDAGGKLTFHIDGTVVTGYGTGYGQYCTVNQIQSTRFYDSNKGGPWTRPYSDGTEGDSLMCWTHAASNSIQYWQDVYGVFYRDTGNSAATGGTARGLPNGYNSSSTASGYDAAGEYQTAASVPNAQELNIARQFYYNWQNSGGKFKNAADWYFKWDSTTNASGPGGYYSEYFGNGTSTRDSFITIHTSSTADTSAGYAPFGNTNAGLKEALLPAFGFTAQSDGSYLQTEEGLMPGIGIWEKNKNTGHIISCQGFTTDAAGNLVSLLVADGDDNTARLQEIYIIEEAGHLMLYKDKEGTKPFYTGAEYYVYEVSYINTPQVLKDMLAEYRSTGEAAVWNGGATNWSTQIDVVDSELAGSSTGWDILVNGANIDEAHHGYYHGYALAGRKVLFGDHAAADKRRVTIVGTVAPGQIEIAAGGYEFLAGENAAIEAGTGLTVRSMASLHSAVQLQLGEVTVEADSTLSSDHAITITGQLATTALTLPGACTIAADLDLSLATGITLGCSLDLQGHRLELNNLPAITLTGDFWPREASLITGIGSLSIAGQEIAPGTDLTQLIQLNTTGSIPLTNYTLVLADTGSLHFALNSTPEPTTTTLSLLAFCALIWRRHRM